MMEAVSGLDSSSHVASRAFKRVRLLSSGVRRDEIDKLEVWEAEAILFYERHKQNKETERWNYMYEILQQKRG